MQFRRVAVPVHGATPWFASLPRRVLGPAFRRARALRLQEAGAVAVIGHAVRWSDHEALRARPARAVPFKARATAHQLDAVDDGPRACLLRRFARRSPQP